MEIFNTVRSTQPHPPNQSQSGTEATHNNIKKSQKSVMQEQKELMHETQHKSDRNKIKKELQEITDKLNKEMDPLKTSIRFGFNDKVDELYISVIDTSNDRVIRKIPSEEAMRLAAKMRELVGMLFDKKG